MSRHFKALSLNLYRILQLLSKVCRMTCLYLNFPHTAFRVKQFSFPDLQFLLSWKLPVFKMAFKITLNLFEAGTHSKHLTLGHNGCEIFKYYGKIFRFWCTFNNHDLWRLLIFWQPKHKLNKYAWVKMFWQRFQTEQTRLYKHLYEKVLDTESPGMEKIINVSVKQSLGADSRCFPAKAAAAGRVTRCSQTAAASLVSGGRVNRLRPGLGY